VRLAIRDLQQCKVLTRTQGNFLSRTRIKCTAYSRVFKTFYVLLEGLRYADSLSKEDEIAAAVLE